MKGLVDCTVDIECILVRWERGIEIGFPNIRFETVNLFQRRVGIEREQVWSEPYDGSCLTS